MVAVKRQKFSSQARPELLKGLRRIADNEGRQFQAVLEEALQEFIEHHETSAVRKAALAHFRASIKKNHNLGELLAK